MQRSHQMTLIPKERQEDLETCSCQVARFDNWLVGRSRASRLRPGSEATKLAEFMQRLEELYF